MGAFGPLIQGYSQYQAADFEAKQAGANADLSATRAAYAEQRGAAEAGRLRSEGSQLVSEQKVALASSGVDISTGSAPNLFASTRAQSEQDVQTARSNAAMEAWGHRVEEAGYRAQRKIARRNSVLGPLSSVIGGYSNMASQNASLLKGG